MFSHLVSLYTGSIVALIIAFTALEIELVLMNHFYVCLGIGFGFSLCFTKIAIVFTIGIYFHFENILIGFSFLSLILIHTTIVTFLTVFTPNFQYFTGYIFWMDVFLAKFSKSSSVIEK